MKLNITKNFIITFFVILAIYQTSGLWFEGFSNHNFFYSFFNSQKNSDDDALLYSLDNIVVNQGSDKLICLKNGIYENDYKSIFDNAVKIIPENGSLLQNDHFDWNNILSVRSVIYQYNCGIDSKSIADMFGFDEGLLPAFSEKIDTIVITSYTTTIPENLTVGFGNRVSGNAFFYSLEKDQYIYTVYDTIGSIDGNDDIYFTSSVKNGLDLFKGNLFIPQWSGNSLEVYPLKTENPFMENDKFEQFKLERAVDVFFDNPVSKWTSFDNGVFTYSDENTVVKYYQNGIMEYYNYSSEKNNYSDDFYSQYVSAVSLLKSDFNISNEYSLSGFSSDSEKTVFYFDYKLNNFSIYLGDDVKNALNMNSAIEVTVSGGRVSKYRRFAKKFVIDDTHEISVKKTFLAAIDEVLADIQSQNNQSSAVIDNMGLVYILDNDERGSLNWIINIDGRDYIKETQITANQIENGQRED